MGLCMRGASASRNCTPCCSLHVRLQNDDSGRCGLESNQLANRQAAQSRAEMERKKSQDHIDEGSHIAVVDVAGEEGGR